MKLVTNIYNYRTQLFSVVLDEAIENAKKEIKEYKIGHWELRDAKEQTKKRGKGNEKVGSYDFYSGVSKDQRAKRGVSTVIQSNQSEMHKELGRNNEKS